MIEGYEFAKFFSEGEEFEASEKLFSTGDEELDELLERVYSAGIEDGYDYAQKEFSKEKDDDDDVDLKFRDKFNKSTSYPKFLYKKGSRLEKAELRRLHGDDDSKKAAIASGIGGALAGGGIGYLGNGVKGAAAGAALGGAAFAGAGYAGTKLGLAARKTLEEISPRYKKNWEKQEDLLKLQTGDISKKDFVKKWGGKINGEKVKGSKED